MPMIRNPRSRGFTLIELLIAIAVGLVVSAAVTTMFVSMYGSNADFLKSMRLNHELRTALEVMARDIRRAGHNRLAASNFTTNPFSNTSSPGTVLSTPTSSSIYFSYDAAVGNTETFGYRLNGEAVEACARTDGALCSAGGSTWEDITDTNLVDVTALTFAQDEVTEGTMRFRQVTITLTGNLRHDTVFAKTLVEKVKVRNEQSTEW